MEAAVSWINVADYGQCIVLEGWKDVAFQDKGAGRSFVEDNAFVLRPTREM